MTFVMMFDSCSEGVFENLGQDIFQVHRNITVGRSPINQRFLYIDSREGGVSVPIDEDCGTGTKCGLAKVSYERPTRLDHVLR